MYFYGTIMNADTKIRTQLESSDFRGVEHHNNWHLLRSCHLRLDGRLTARAQSSNVKKTSSRSKTGSLPTRLQIPSYCFPLIISSAKAVPFTRERIFANAFPRVVEVSSQNGEKPQSSVVPSCSTGIYLAASRVRSRISSGLSTRGSLGETTPMKTRLPGQGIAG
jgi:hypothetical protein